MNPDRFDPQTLEAALSTHKALTEAGHLCYFAGGCVRDGLLGESVKDIDLATSASVEEVTSLFDRVIPLGKRFGSVVVLYQKDHASSIPVEVTTFREDGEYIDGRRPSSIIQSSPQMDALRRDFTINGLFYDPKTKEIIDYVGGITDLEKGLLRAIGDPYKRFEEDRLRMLRAVRFMSSFSLSMDPTTQEAIKKLSGDLYPKTSIERVAQEVEKMDSFSREKASLFLSYSIRKGLFRTLQPSFAPSQKLNENLEHFLIMLRPLALPQQIFALYLLQQIEQSSNLPSDQSISDFCDFWKCSKVMRGRNKTVASFLQLAIQDPHISPSRWRDLLLQASESEETKNTLDLFASIIAFFSSYQLSEKATRENLLSFAQKWPTFYSERREFLENWHKKRPLISAGQLIAFGVPKGPKISQLQEALFIEQLKKPGFSQSEAKQFLQDQKDQKDQGRLDD